MKRILSVCFFILVSPMFGKRVYLGMVADLFHAGHVNILREAKKMGDYLIVGLTTDHDAKKYKREPICTFEERKTVVEACKYVDEVVEDIYQMNEEFIEKHHIDIIVHGNDMDDATLRFFYSVALDKGMLRMLPYTHGISTSEIIKRICTRFGINAEGGKA